MSLVLVCLDLEHLLGQGGLRGRLRALLRRLLRLRRGFRKRLFERLFHRSAGLEGPQGEHEKLLKGWGEAGNRLHCRQRLLQHGAHSRHQFHSSLPLLLLIRGESAVCLNVECE